MSNDDKLREAETDLEALIVRSRNVLPTLRRVIEDTRYALRDITVELLGQLEKAIENAEQHKHRRRHDFDR